ncbi:MAG: L-threonylcarbamoyladenylate synthase [bacterium]
MSGTETIFISLVDDDNNKKKYLVALDKATNILKNDGLVAFPTETVYGLGANALKEKAVSKIFKAKGRPADNPLIVHISNFKQLDLISKNIPQDALKLMDYFFPGALTIVLQKSDLVPYITSGGLETVAVRMPNNRLAIDLINRCGFPIAAPSANKSTKPSPTSGEHVMQDFNGLIEMVIDAGRCEHGIESTVVQVLEEETIILRPGSITKEMLEQVVDKVSLSGAILNDLEETSVKSPGVKYKHYAPKGEVCILNYKNKCDLIIYLNKNLYDSYDSMDSTKFFISQEVFDIVNRDLNNDNLINNVFIMGSEKDLSSIGSNIFYLLRECDRLDIKKIYVQAIEEEGLGLAIMNRLKKASSGNIINID